MLPKRRLKRMNYSFICLKKTTFVPHNHANDKEQNYYNIPDGCRNHPLPLLYQQTE